MPEPEPLDDLRLVSRTVQAAGTVALDWFRRSIRHRLKLDGSPVTEADEAVDAFLKTALLEARPDDGWLSEESFDDLARLGRRRLWIVDPIDGTRAFMRGGDQWCIVAAMVLDGRPIAAAVHRPVTGDVYMAAAGRGATLNGRPLHVSERTSLAGVRIIASRAVARRLRLSPDLDAIDAPLALRLCLIAEGHYDAALSFGPKHDWDLAAGDLLVHEAGGRVTGLDGQVYIFNRAVPRQGGLVAGGPDMHEQILGAVGQG